MIPMIPKTLPIVRIDQTSGQLGLEAPRGKQTLQQPKADLNLDTRPPSLSIDQRNGVLRVDSSRAWDALGRGGTLKVMEKIYSHAYSAGLQATAQIAAEGDRMAASLRTGENAIAELARGIRYDFGEYNFAGPAAYNNVKVDYQAFEPDIRATEGEVRLDVGVNAPIHEYTPSPVNIYMVRYPSIAFYPPPPAYLDVYV